MADIATEKDFTIVKGKIFTPKHNFYGLVVAILDNFSSSVGSISLVFSIYSETHDLSLDDSWDKFEKKIQDMTYSGNFSQAITTSTLDKLKADTSIGHFGNELKDNIARKNNTLISKQFQDILSKSMNDATLEVNCSFEEVTTTELEEGRLREKNQEAPKEPADEGVETPPDYRLVKAKLILAPLDGKLITDLKEGDTIMVNLIPMSMQENIIIDKLKLRRPDGSARPAPGKLIKIQNYKKGWQLLVHIIENYYTKIIEEEKIMVKTITGTAEKKGIGMAKPKKQGSSGISWIAIGVVILLGMVITYFAFLGG